jgi:predicted RNA-binding protein with PUA domain
MHLLEGGRVVTDAPNVLGPWFIYVCGVCEMPTESEPCREHQPDAWKEITYGATNLR